MPTPQYTFREDHGGRMVATSNIKGVPVEVVSGWDITEDRWRFHVYIHNKQTGGMERVPVLHPLADSQDAAIAAGFQVAADSI
jgi:hypothetical protein